MSNPEYEDAYLIITRSQIAEMEALGELPPGSLEQIGRALLASPEFDVLVRNRDAIVFTRRRYRGIVMARARMGSALAWPLTITISVALMGLLLLADVEGPFRVIVALWFFCVCPGMAFAPLLPLGAEADARHGESCSASSAPRWSRP